MVINILHTEYIMTCHAHIHTNAQLPLTDTSNPYEHIQKLRYEKTHQTTRI